ncbi:MAG: hypothetical protein KAS32_27300, partial [Candidatus Peribacteraceae bacterium]|nr:hypothetical protein [Candidatus Peribacteraceae bacterium]
MTFAILMASVSGYTYFEPLSMSNITDSANDPLATGNTTVLFYATLTSTTPIYNQTFTDSIDNGKFDELISSADFTVTTYYGSIYYLDILVNDENASFYNNTEDRYNFTFSTGVINSTHIDDSVLWDEAYGWGNHSDAGYITTNLVNTTEDMQDAVMAAIDDGTQTHITVTYQDATNDMDFVVSDDWYDSVSDIPTATPSDGDTTHISTADHIHDYIESLNHATENTNVTFENITATGYIAGQPLHGIINKGMIHTDEYEGGLLNVTDNGTHVFYPAFTGEFKGENDTLIICEMPSGNFEMPSRSARIGIVNSTCDAKLISTTEFLTFGEDKQRNGRMSFMYVLSGSESIELLYGEPQVGDIMHLMRLQSIYVRNLRVISGMDISEETFPELTQTAGKYAFDIHIAETTAQNSTEDTIHLVHHIDSENWTCTNQTGINLTHCDNGTDLVPCSTDQLRRYVFYTMGHDNNPDRTQMHQLAPIDSEDFVNIGNCLDIETTPITYTIPIEQTYAAVMTHIYCGARDDISFASGGWIDLRAGITGFGATVDTSVFLTKDMTGSPTGNWDIDGYTIYGGIFNGTFNGAWNNSGLYSTTTESDALYRAETWDNFTGIPTATPSNGDTTHFSTADEIFDYIASLNYKTLAEIGSDLGNWSSDKDSYWNESSDLDDDELAEAKISFSTPCAAGNHYYLNGNDLACEADDDTTYTN